MQSFGQVARLLGSAREQNVASATAALHLAEAGAGPPLVLLHGLGSSSRYWEPNLPRLSRSFRVLMPDLLGFGRSPRPRAAAYNTSEHLDALTAALWRRLPDAAVVAGHSMGAILALHLAAHHPERVAQLILISPPIIGSRIWGHGDGWAARLHHATVHSGPAVALAGAGMTALHPLWQWTGPRLRRDIPPNAVRDAMHSDWRAYWQSLEQVVYGADIPALVDALPRPPHIIHGGKDRVAPPAPVRELAARRSALAYTEIAGAGHNPCYTHPHALYEALRV